MSDEITIPASFEKTRLFLEILREGIDADATSEWLHRMVDYVELGISRDTEGLRV